ncbi:hypothetical protein HYW21_05130 [Candidatus Woesearchaeota archaeon]|nr:hypothetical protein [Candidatus Woesearchaeota archaeon]
MKRDNAQPVSDHYTLTISSIEAFHVLEKSSHEGRYRLEDRVLAMVSTFELPDAKREFVTRVALGVLRDPLSPIVTFSDQYSYIAGLAESVTFAYTDRFDSSRTDEAFINSRKRYYDIVYGNQQGLDEEDTPARALGIEQVYEIVEAHFEEPYRSLLSNFIDRSHLSTSPTRLTQDELEKRIDGIRERLMLVADEFGRDGKIVLPRRPIRTVSFDPLVVTFGRRYYHGNPLEFYEHYRETYDGLSRTGLFQFDNGLYKALWKADQLAQAIPTIVNSGPNGLTQAEIDKIVHALEPGKRSLKLVSQETGHTRVTVRKYGSRAGLEDMMPTHEIPEKEKKRIVALYEPCKGNVTEAARRSGHSWDTVDKYWSEAHLDERKEGASLHPLEVREVLALYDPANPNIAAVARRSGYRWGTVKNCWENAGYILRGKGGAILPEETTRIIDAYTTYQGNASRTARELGFHRDTIVRQWSTHGLKPTGKWRKGRKKANDFQ